MTTHTHTEVSQEVHPCSLGQVLSPAESPLGSSQEQDAAFMDDFQPLLM